MSDIRIVDLLCEDSVHQFFLRRVLQQLGSRIEGTPKLPAGAGAGDQFVRREYPKAVARWRQKSHDKNVATVVAIDADQKSVRERKRELDKTLDKCDGIEVRGSDDNIAILVPKRNIETWIKSLRSERVNEQKDYKHQLKLRNNESDCLEAAKSLVTLLRKWCGVDAANQRELKSQENHPASLWDGCKEIDDRVPLNE